MYRANPHYPEASLLRRLLSGDDVASRSAATHALSADNAKDASAREFLAAHGAPWGPPNTLPPAVKPETALLQGLALARRDATVARVIPLVLWRLRDTLDWAKVSELAREQGQADVLGFFLELAGKLGKDKRLCSLSAGLRDRRRTRPRLFFARPHGPEALRAARRNTPAGARRFGFIMNLGLDSFESAFRKHAATR